MLVRLHFALGLLVQPHVVRVLGLADHYVGGVNIVVVLTFDGGALRIGAVAQKVLGLSDGEWGIR